MNSQLMFHVFFLYMSNNDSYNKTEAKYTCFLGNHIFLHAFPDLAEWHFYQKTLQLTNIMRNNIFIHFLKSHDLLQENLNSYSH